MNIFEVGMWLASIFCCVVIFAMHRAQYQQQPIPAPTVPTDLTWEQVNTWFDNFYDEYVESKKKVRGRAFSGSHMEVWGDTVVVILHDPYARGEDDDQKALDFVRGIFDENTRTLRAEVSHDRFERVVNGTEPLTDADWAWQDEE